jgi:hypothetical protein
MIERLLDYPDDPEVQAVARAWIADNPHWAARAQRFVAALPDD